MNGFGNPFFQNQRLRSVQNSPQTQRARDMTTARRQFQDEDKMIADFPSRTAYDQAVYDRAQGIAADRSSPQNRSTSTLTSSPNLRFPATEGGELGMSRDVISEKAREESLRLEGKQPLGLIPQPTNFETAGVKKESGGVIQTPYGIMSASVPVGQKEFESSTAGIQGTDRPERYAMTPTGNFQRQLSGADDRALAMAGMAERGAAIGARLAEEQRNRYYAFRQGVEERRAQEALSTERGRGPETMRGYQALAQAERFKQAQEGRSPMSRAPLRAFGMDFRTTSMGQVTPIQRPQTQQQYQSPFARSASSPMTAAGGGGPQPLAGMPLGTPSQTGMGDIFSSPRIFDEDYISPFSYGSFTGI